MQHKLFWWSWSNDVEPFKAWKALIEASAPAPTIFNYCYYSKWRAEIWNRPASTLSYELPSPQNDGMQLVMPCLLCCVQVSAKVLKAMKQTADESSEQPIVKAVITVPAYFNNSQREATISAGTTRLSTQTRLSIYALNAYWLFNVRKWSTNNSVNKRYCADPRTI